ncbi:MAG: hypothetical protein GF308_03695 [Candidatus Heimdallarchaeota archaeon]|nr:hypothetical protein [Candidatus Heimdallarchaeota archaeon]
MKKIANNNGRIYSMKIGINGTGLTGRSIVKLLYLEKEFQDIELGQINGRSMTIEALRDRLIYSSSQGHSKLHVEVDKDKEELIIEGRRVKYTTCPNPEEIQWLPEVELVIEATGKFRDISNESNNPKRHFQAPNNNIKAVVISAPGKGGLEDYMWAATPNLKTELRELIEKGDPFIIGGASCTTTATVPIVDTLDEAFGMESCYLTTVHAVTRSQDILDGSKGWSGMDTQLHTTGATKSTNRVLRKSIPMDGIAFRTSDKAGSFVQIDAILKKTPTKEEILEAFKNSKYANYLSYSNVTNPPSSYIRGDHNMVMLIPDEIVHVSKGRIVVRGLYDNEEGYAAHFLRLVNFIIKELEG